MVAEPCGPCPSSARCRVLWDLRKLQTPSPCPRGSVGPGLLRLGLPEPPCPTPLRHLVLIIPVFPVTAGVSPAAARQEANRLVTQAGPGPGAEGGVLLQTQAPRLPATALEPPGPPPLTKVARAKAHEQTQSAGRPARPGPSQGDRNGISRRGVVQISILFLPWLPPLQKVTCASAARPPRGK